MDICCRWRKHKEALQRGNHRNRYLQRAWNKYGPSAFDIVISEYTVQDLLNMIEQKYLNVARLTPDKVYNLSFLADRIEMTDSVKEILRGMAKDRFKDKRKHPFYGKKHKFETIDKIKHTLKGRFGGMTNPNADSKIYTFYNNDIKSTFVGTRCDFCQKYSIHSSRVSAIICKLGRVKRVKGWSITPV